MHDPALVQACIEQHYDLRPQSLQPFNPNSWTRTERHTYRVTYADGASSVLRAYRPGWVERTMPYDSFDTWLHTRAALLAWLEHQHYPAPQLIRTRQGNAVARHQDWGILMTTFIEGTSATPEPHTFEVLGATLAQLHILPDSRIPPHALGAVSPSGSDGSRAVAGTARSILCDTQHATA